MKFTKMHGLGNDYVYVDTRMERVGDPAAVARAVSNRYSGIGSDGLILIQPSTVADLRMEIYNADGSRAQMCGNGIRCVAKYAVEHGIAPGPELAIETDSGVKPVSCRVRGNLVDAVRVDMGVPSLASADVGSTLTIDRIINHPMAFGGNRYELTCVSIGNPHAVIFVCGSHGSMDAASDPLSPPRAGRRGTDEAGSSTGLSAHPPMSLEAVPLDTIGPLIESAPEFPGRINVHFVRVDSAARVTVRTWERGSGATRACGTGACAVCVAGVVTGRCHRSITAALPGGDLGIEWAEDAHVYMTGPAVEVFSGTWPASPQTA